jgi:uncharacterized repeat protein (TIGR03806 family)
MNKLIFILVLALTLGSCGKKSQDDLSLSEVKVLTNLTEYGLFDKVTKDDLDPKSSGIPYDLNTPLFTDYAEKERVIFLPEGTSMEYDSENEFNFPVGAIIAKTFSLPKHFSDANGVFGKRIETRLLINQPKGWFAVSYVWNKDDTEANIAYAGENVPVNYEDSMGKKKSFTYAVPSRNQCAACHQAYEGRSQSIVPIGIRARHLNKTYAYKTPDGIHEQNQLDYMESKGALDGKPYWGVPKLVDAMNSKESINDRARAYLDINCAHCHRDEAAGGINSKLILTHNERDLSRLGVCKTPGSAGKGAAGLRYDIVPGKPEESILYHRVATTDPGAIMPQIGRATAHKEGVELLYKWIDSMDKKDCP